MGVGEAAAVGDAVALDAGAELTAAEVGEMGATTACDTATADGLVLVWRDVEQALNIKAATPTTVGIVMRRGSDEGTPHLRPSGGPCSPIRRLRGSD